MNTKTTNDTSSTGGSNECLHAMNLGLKRAEEPGLEADEADWLADHLATCESCRLEHGALSALAADDTADPAAPLDDLERHRLLDDVLDRAAALELQPAAAERPRRRLPVALAAGFALALIAGVVAWWASSGSAASGPASSSPGAENPIRARVALLTGELRQGGRPVPDGTRLDLSQQLATGSGGAVLDLPDGISLVLGPKSALRATPSATDGVEVRLDRGTLTASVTPGGKERRLAIATSSGRVSVVGTVFSVSAGAAAEVRVLRGRVEVTAEDGARRSLGPSQGMVIGEPKVRQLSAGEEERLSSELGLAELADARDDAVIEVQSVPNGVPVKIDGRPIGATPLSIALRAGHYQLALDRPDGESVRELIDIGPGARLTRQFDLKRSPPPATEPEVETVVTPSRPSDPPAQPATVKELLDRAQSSRAERNWTGAAKAYGELLRRYPGSAQARAAHISLGEIQLEKLGQPGAALKNFERYLARGAGGPLAQEALYDKARALRALGRTAHERQALEQLVARFPRSFQARAAKQRLADLSGPSPNAAGN